MRVKSREGSGQWTMELGENSCKKEDMRWALKLSRIYVV
jgi:hypothetical protein